MPRRAVDFPVPQGLPFSAAVFAGDLLYLSGQVGLDAQTGALAGASAAGQTEKIFENAKALLEAAGKTLGDVVKANVYLVAMEDYPAMNAVYARHFATPYPARTAVAVAALPLGARVEIEFIVN